MINYFKSPYVIDKTRYHLVRNFLRTWHILSSLLGLIENCAIRFALEFWLAEITRMGL